MITRTILVAAYRRAIRTGVIHSLRPDEKALLKLTIKTLKTIKSKALRQALEKILEKIRHPLKTKALTQGIQILKRKIRQALALGHAKAREWISQPETALYLGIAHMNTSPLYR